MLRFVAAALVATLACQGAALAQTKKKRAPQAPAPVTKPQDDQSYLFVGAEPVERRSPDYVNIGQSSRQQPYSRSYMQAGQAKSNQGGYVLPIPGTAGAN
jgi:hypothetical protein